MAALTPGGLKRAKDSQDTPLTLQVFELQKDGKVRAVFSDGEGRMQGMFASQLCTEAGKLQEGAVLCAKSYQVHSNNDELRFLVLAMDVISNDGPNPHTPLAKKARTDEAAGDAKENVGALANANSTPLLTPSMNMKAEAGATPMGALPLSPVRTPPTGPTPPAPHCVARDATTGAKATPGSAAAARSPAPTAPLTVRDTRPGVRPIAALNPYDTSMTIKAKVMRKAPLRSFQARGATKQVFSVELADEEGTAIQGTFWGSAVDRYSGSLEEGKVYYFSRFSVKPANKAFSSVRNDYEISFDERCEVEECADQSAASAIRAAVDVVPFDRLPGYIGRKVVVDVVGVVVSVAQLRSIKRKSDDSDVPCRNVTLADQTGHSVMLTLWDDGAVSPLLEGAEGAVLQVTSVRVTDFNGCSLNGVSRSTLVRDPDTPEGVALRTWWDAAGSSAPLMALGQAGGGAGGGGGGGARSDNVVLISEMIDNEPGSGGKPTFASVMGTLSFIRPDQPMYYLANPDNGKKVVAQGDRYWCEGDGKWVDRPEHRYMLSAKVMDASGEVYLAVFNKEAERLLGMTAEKLAEIKEDPAREEKYKAVLKEAQWSSWVIGTVAKRQEYQGEQRMRYQARTVAPVDYAVQGRRLVQLIAGGRG